MDIDVKFKRLFLHVGLGKTGTTTVQRELLAKADLLESRYGLHYPRGFSHAKRFEGNHSILFRTLFPTEQVLKNRLAVMGLTTQQAVDEFNDRTIEQFRRGFESTTASNLLLSAETVGHFQNPELKALAEWLSEIAESVTVVACIRHPMHALSSEIQQRLNLGEVLDALHEKPPVYKLRPLFNRLGGAFGPENIKAYSFAHAVRQERGMTATLLQQLGIDADADFPKTRPANTSMSHEGALLLSACNEQRPALINGARNPERLGVGINYFRKIPGRPYRAPLAVYNAVADSTAKDVQWVEQEYGIELGGFDAPAEQDYRVFSQESIDYIADVLADRSRHKYALLASCIKLLARPYLALQKIVRPILRR